MSERHDTDRWRTGRKVGRTIYAQVGAEPADTDPLIGVMDTPELAADAVACHNASSLAVRGGPMLHASVPRSPSPLAWEIAKTRAIFSGGGTAGTPNGYIRASFGLYGGQFIEGFGSTTNEALRRLAVALDEWNRS